MQEEEHSIPEMVEDVRTGKMPRRHFMKKLTTMGISTVGIGTIIAAISSSSPAITTAASYVSDHPTQHLQRHDEHLAHQSRGNIPALHNDYAEHAIVEDSMHPHPFVGRAAIMGRKNMITAAASEAQITVTNRVVHGNQVTAEWVATGIHTGDLPDLPASGRPFTLRGVTVVVRHDDKIVREALYYNVAELHRQLG